MNYEKEYKKLKADIEKAYLFAQTDSTKAVLEHILPELKESDGEKIRKELLAWLKDKQANPSIGFSPIKMEQWIVWLEKQVPIDEEKVLIGARKDVALSIMNFLNRNTLGMDLSSMECADLESAVIDSDWSKVYDYMKKKLENQGEKPQGKTALEAIKEEKIDNANYVKSADKVKPKFHKGDWVVVSTTKGDRVVQIASVEYFKDGHPSYFTTEGRWFGNGTKARLLTNKDVEITTIPENRAIVNKIKSWSKEDEDYYDAIIAKLEVTQDDAALTDNQMEFLKSLKQRMGWKPTKKQMDALLFVVRHYTPNVTERLAWDSLKTLEIMYNDLKKL